MKEIIRSLNLINIQHKQPRITTISRGEYIYKDLDDIWSFNGYDKLKRWGINIYNAIDAYSRRLL